MSLIKLAESFGLTPDGLMAGTGPAARRKAVNPARVQEAAELLGKAWAGNSYANLLVHEALATSDLFKSVTGDVLDVAMLAQYDPMPTQWGKFASRTTLRNFKPKLLRELSGGRSAFERVPELTDYPSADYRIGERTISVGKFGRRFGYSFEARINDDLDELRQVPNEFANAARLTEDRESLKSLVTIATGAPNTAFFKAANGNIGTGALTQTNLQAAITTVSTKRDVDGNLLSPGPLQLVVGPALQFTAQRVLDQQVVRVTNGALTTEEPNPLRGRLTLTVLENLPGTAWFILPMPAASRPAFYTGFLLGYETPDLRYKADQGNRVGGGAVGPDEGDFDVDAVYYRARHIVGAAQGDPMFTWASDGLGT